MKNSHIRMASIGLVTFSLAACAGVALADGPQSPRTTAPTAPVPAPAMPPDLARHVQEVTDTVLEHHIDPPARQQMILSGIKALYRAAGVPVPLGLGRRVSAVTTPEQLAALLEEVWPKSTAKSVAAKELEEALLEGLLAAVPGGAELMTAKESKVAEQMAGNRYVGIHIALGMDDKEKRPTMSERHRGRARRSGRGQGRATCIEEVDGVDTKGMKLRDVVDRLRGDEGTDVTDQGPAARRRRSPGRSRSPAASSRTRRSRASASIVPGDWEAPTRRSRSDRLPEDHRDHGQHAARAAQAGAADGERGNPGTGARPARPRSGDIACTRPSCWPTACSSTARSGASGRHAARRPTRPTPMPCSAAGRSPCSSIRTRRAPRNGSRRPFRTTIGPIVVGIADLQAPTGEARRRLPGIDGAEPCRVMRPPEVDDPRRRRPMVDLAGDRLPRARRRSPPGRSRRGRARRVLGAPRGPRGGVQPDHRSLGPRTGPRDRRPGPQRRSAGQKADTAEQAGREARRRATTRSSNAAVRSSTRP